MGARSDTKELLAHGRALAEADQLLPSARPSRKTWGSLLFFMGSTIVLSIGIINFNRYLMVQNRFHYPGALVFIHMVFCSTASFALRFFIPSWFPSLTNPEKRVAIDMRLIVGTVCPIAVCFAASLILANAAYAFLSIAFLQMLKETGAVTTYGFSLLAGLETYSNRHLQIITVAMLGAVLSVHGEMHFSMTGFIIQLCSQLTDCARLVMQSLALSDRKLDPMSYLLLMSPACCILLGVVLGLMQSFPADVVPVFLAWPTLPELNAWASVLLASSCVAFLLNISTTMLLQRAGPMLYMFTGVLKDIGAVFTSVFLVGEPISGLQCLAFFIQICAVYTWGLFKACPVYFEDGIFLGLQRSLGLADLPRSAAEAAIDGKLLQDAEAAPLPALWDAKLADQCKAA